ncbi:MAG: hypothetical protein H0T72_02655 [Chloroflexia bacterium]|nr:hypothetical protein [Chloroflexia bacterium]
MLNLRERPSQAKVRPTRTTHFRILDHSDAIDLLCDVDVEAFYAGLGFQKFGGMCVRNYENQAGAGKPGRTRRSR